MVVPAHPYCVQEAPDEKLKINELGPYNSVMHCETTYLLIVSSSRLYLDCFSCGSVVVQDLLGFGRATMASQYRVGVNCGNIYALHTTPGTA